MRRGTRRPTDGEDEIDFRAVARVGVLIGANFTLTGILARYPVLRSMAEAYAIQPALTPDQTFLVGLAFLTASAGIHAWRRKSNVARHQ